MIIKIYNTSHTTPNTQFGGVNFDLLMSLYHPLLLVAGHVAADPIIADNPTIGIGAYAAQSSNVGTDILYIARIMVDRTIM